MSKSTNTRKKERVIKVEKRISDSGHEITMTFVRSSERIQPPSEKTNEANAFLASQMGRFPEAFPPMRKRRKRKPKN